MGLQARLMSQALRKLTSVIGKTGTVCIFINQLREKVGISYGNPETTTGGKALKFYASVRLDIRRKEYLKDGDKVVGNRVAVKVVKNKVAPPFRVAVVDIVYGEGISVEGSILDNAVAQDIIKKSGAWYSYGETRIGQGRENARKYLKENLEARAEIEGKVRTALLENKAATPLDAGLEEEDDMDIMEEEI